MEERASIPPGLPRDRPISSYWQSPPDEIADLRTSETLPEAVDIVIVGSGISGSTVAYNILSARPELKVILLEARQAASGASGRNGGHTKHASYRTFSENIEIVGIDDAVKIAQLEYDCMTAVHQFIKENKIDCDGRQCDTVDVYFDQPQFEQARKSVEQMQKQLGEKNPASRYIFHDSAQTAKRFLTPDSYGSLQYEAGSLNAYRLTIAILKLALSKGLNLQCNTPVTSINALSSEPTSRSSWSVATPRGSVSAPTVILATNGYTPHLVPSLQGTILPFRGIVTAHRPGSLMPQNGLDTTYSFVYDKGYEYMVSIPGTSRVSHSGDIIIGGGLTKTKTSGPDGVAEFGNTDDTSIDPDIEAYLAQSTESFFGKNWGNDHPNGRIRGIWSGVMGYSADGYPFVGQVPGQEGLWLDASFQGHGMVLCFLCARALTEMVLGESVNGGGDTKALDSWFPQCYRVTKERVNKKYGEATTAKEMGIAVEGAQRSSEIDGQLNGHP